MSAHIDPLGLTRLIQEVPGAPPEEAWFLWRNRRVEQNFRSLAEAEAYCAARGIKVDAVEHDGQ